MLILLENYLSTQNIWNSFAWEICLSLACLLTESFYLHNTDLWVFNLHLGLNSNTLFI